jgi:hypothetical protein
MTNISTANEASLEMKTFLPIGCQYYKNLLNKKALLALLFFVFVICHHVMH